MHIDANRLLKESGIPCIKLEMGMDGDFVSHAALAAFITPRSSSHLRCRPDSGGSDVRYGDLILKVEAPGGPRGERIPPHRDAGLALRVPGSDTLLPFSGPHMLGARDLLFAHRNLMPAHIRRTVLCAISDMFEMIILNPDRDRFGDRMISHAFQAGLFDGAAPNPSVDDLAFSRKARFDLARAMMDKLRPQAQPNARILFPQIMEKHALRAGDPDLSRLMMTHGSLRRRIVDVLSSAERDSIHIGSLADGSIDLLKDAGFTCLSGRWTDAVRDASMKAIDIGDPEGKPEILLMTGKGLDLLVLRSENEGDAGLVVWPSQSRFSVFPYGGERFACLSPEEIPDEEAISELQMSLSKIRIGAFIGTDEKTQEEWGERSRTIA